MSKEGSYGSLIIVLRDGVSPFPAEKNLDNGFKYINTDGQRLLIID